MSHFSFGDYYWKRLTLLKSVNAHEHSQASLVDCSMCGAKLKYEHVLVDCSMCGAKLKYELVSGITILGILTESKDSLTDSLS